MVRVTEKSSSSAVTFAVNKAKSKLEELQLKGANLKKIRKPSDNPTGNAKALQLSSRNKNIEQYLKNIDYAEFNVNIIEKSVEEITNILNKAKEIAVLQSSDFYGADIKENVAEEVTQLKKQLMGISSKRLGNRYIFSGHQSLTKPFDEFGNYYGDDKNIEIEIAQDFRIPVTLNGKELFYFDKEIPVPTNKKDESNDPSRQLASTQETKIVQKNIIQLVDALETSLRTNDKFLTQSLLEDFDTATKNVIQARTKLGSVTNSIESFRNKLEKEEIDNKELKSKIVDADIADLFSEVSKQQQVLGTAYKSGQAIINRSLMDFLK
tara:strand:+ start:7116 stop:8084 length:969 start_codon:yes stop_codon:yes gene_type:complete